MNPIEIYQQLEKLYPDAHCELNYTSPYELTIAVILSAQTTDVAVNKITPALFKAYPTVISLAEADVSDVEQYIRSIGLYRNKAKNIVRLAIDVKERFNGKVPSTMDELVSLPGVGRKSANVILSECFHIPSIAVDTHVERVSKRLLLADKKDTVYQVEMALQKAFPSELWNSLHHLLIFFGRYKCKSLKPLCEDCPFASFCNK